jgi:hypothetical protein
VSLFVLGPSRSGKTPFASQVALALGCPHVGASEWVRRRFPPAPYPDRAAFVAAITAFTLAELKRNPRACVEYVRSHYDLSLPCVVEGVRNPHDFVHLFDPRTDSAVFLHYIQNDLPATAFEAGLDLIRRYLAYLQATGLLEPARVVEYRFPEFHQPAGVLPDGAREEAPGVRAAQSLDAAILDFLQTARTAVLVPPVPAGEVPAARPQRVHADIPPLKTHVRGEYLYDMDLRHAGEHLPCTAFAVSSYPGSVPTFKILLPDGTVFSYVPPSALVDPARKGEPLELADLVYHNCPSGDFCVHSFEALDGLVQAFFKRPGLWLAGSYLFTIDWYTGNDLLHLIALENGQYAFLPHHKVKFRDGTRELPPYRKMHGEWKV